MCKYEKECYSKEVGRVTTEYSNVDEDPCERNELSCDIYRTNRAIARNSVLDNKHQLRIAC